MSPTDQPLHAPRDDEIRVLAAGPAARRGLAGVLLGATLLLLVGAAGLTFWLRPDLFGLADALAPPPPPAPGNLLGEAWSFETTEAGSAASAWRVPDEAPAGFRFTAAARVSGELGAASEAEAGSWARLVQTAPVPLGAHRGAVELSGTARDGTLQLALRFEAPGRPPCEIVVASGSGRLSGTAAVPPGSVRVAAVLGAVGPGSLDDLELRFVDGSGDLATRGIFSVQPWQRGLLVFKGAELVVQVEGPGLRDAEGRPAPAGALELPGEQALALPDGSRVAVSSERSGDERSLQLRDRLMGLPSGALLVRSVTVAGSLASQPVGVVSSRGLERFTTDFRVEGVRSLVLGRTVDRLGLALGADATLVGTWQADERILLTAEWPAGDGSEWVAELQTSFQEERVAATQHRDRARAAEAAGRLGEALAEVETIVTRYPHDEEVLAFAVALRARIQADLQERLDRIDQDLADAIFLASAQRCREVLAECREAAAIFAGSEASRRFRERGDLVALRAADLLEEDRRRSAERLQAIRDSFAAAGGHERVVAEIDRQVERHLAPAADGAAEP